MDNRDVADIPAASRSDLIAQRLRIGSLILAAVLAANAALDATIRPGGLGPVTWIYAADFALVIAVQLVTRDPRARARMVPFAGTAVVLWNVLFCSYAVLTPAAIHALVAPTIVITTAAALLLPWGLVAQTVVASICVATYAAAVALSHAGFDLGVTYALVSAIGAAAVSCAGAFVIAQHAQLIDEQTSNLREMNRLMREAGIKKDEFLANVSHELRTPLNVVLGYIDLLLDHSFGPLEPAQRDVLHRITRNASDLSRLINDLIDLSRIEAGRLRVDIGAVELPALFGELGTVMDVLLAGRNVEFSSDVDAQCGVVVADPDRLKQIISNLLVNAVKFTERGAIRLAAVASDAGGVAISVTDTGIGIPETAHQAIFEPFRQVHDRSRRVAGAGIGLSLSSRLAQLMGGTLGVESEPGQGSRFTLTVPAAAPSSEPLRHVV